MYDVGFSPTWRIGFSPMCYLMLHTGSFHSIRFCYTRCSSNIPSYWIYPVYVLWNFPLLSHIYTCIHLCIRLLCVHSLFLVLCVLFFIVSSFWTNLCKGFKINRTHTQTQKLTIRNWSQFTFLTQEASNARAKKIKTFCSDCNKFYCLSCFNGKHYAME